MGEFLLGLVVMERELRDDAEVVFQSAGQLKAEAFVVGIHLIDNLGSLAGREDAQIYSGLAEVGGYAHLADADYDVADLAGIEHEDLAKLLLEHLFDFFLSWSLHGIGFWPLAFGLWRG